MSSITLGAMGVLAALLLIALRVPIAVALGLVSFFGIMELTNMRAALGIITAVPFNFIGNWSFTAVPMFLLMGYVCTTSGMTHGRRIVHLRSGLLPLMHEQPTTASRFLPADVYPPGSG